MGDNGVGWIGCLDDLRHVGARLAERAVAAGNSRREADLAVKLFGAIMGAYLSHLWAEPDHPSFLPSVGYYQMYGSPNPDTVYRTAAIDAGGEYLITGYRGSVPDVSIMPFGPPTASGLQTFPPFEFAGLAIDDDGRFDVSLSQQRPPNARNWWQLEPGMRALMMRSVTDEWGRHTEPRVAIVRLDCDPRRPRVAAEALRPRLQSFAVVVEAMVMSGVKRVEDLRADDVVNRVVEVDYSGSGGLKDQWYQEGCFSLDDGQVVVVEAHLHPDCRAFSLSLTDPFFSTIDWANAQSSLNRHQAVIDSDGVLRAVVAEKDPGVHNWLDTTGHESGVLQCRWLGGDAAPAVSIRAVPAAALDQVLPGTAAPITPEERIERIRARQIGTQLRSYW